MGCLSYKLYRLFLSPHSLSVTTVTLGSRLFFYSAANKLTSSLSLKSERNLFFSDFELVPHTHTHTHTHTVQLRDVQCCIVNLN